MRIEHVALWTTSPERLERLRDFYCVTLGGHASARYESRNRPGFLSYFVTLNGGGARIELMSVPGIAPRAEGEAEGWSHIALALGSRAAVDDTVTRLASLGVPVVSEPRVTGDGYYEAVVKDPDGNLLEITA